MASEGKTVLGSEELDKKKNAREACAKRRTNFAEANMAKKKAHGRGAKPVVGGGKGSIPAGPLLEKIDRWLFERGDITGLSQVQPSGMFSDAREPMPEPSLVTLCEDVGTHPRSILRIRKAGRVSEDLADRLLTQMGYQFSLVYDLDELEAA